MENEFTKVMSERSNEELIKIVTVDTSNYNATAIEAAHSEIEKRAINTSEFEELKEKATLIKTQEVKTSSVDSGVRLLNFTIDFIVWLIIVFIGSFIIEYFIAPSSQSMISFLIYALIFGTYLAYYAIMELKFQKTVGKFITKTKVVKLNGEKPKSGEIINRTFCRLIPFDRISFVFTNNGFHDYVSKTKVVKDSAVKEY
ncbi:RDD family protein [Bizionia gelidisalsuginis]|uniref:RDD family protein n=1 Tax=Bizionia gelidisalsuginis TaxID=291188 RepID=A0ABY3MES3_9FLAO|nr:RDD family protein [Bizionia gelidisalsuginis]TYC18099.1 RDD family protein [Bizionia gelidisalsuginis]